jgi:hypothetical protein
LRESTMRCRGRGGCLSCRYRRKRLLFLKKKKQKDFTNLVKFFGSFFQERTLLPS